MSSTFLPISISEKAVEKIKRIRASKKVPDTYGIRILVEGVGCLGHSFNLGFDLAKDNDDVFTINGLSVIISKKNLLYVAGQYLDYLQNDEQQGFMFSAGQNIS
jgi:iron-sulfur cluster assembly protein